MKMKLFILGICGILGLTLYHVGSADPPAPSDKKVLICHRSVKGAPGRVLSVGEDAVKAHLAHGDCLAGEEARQGDRCNCSAPPPPSFPG